MSSVVDDVAHDVAHDVAAGVDQTVTWAALTETASDVAGHLNAQHGRLIDLAAQLLADPTAWAGEGLWRPEQFLTWRCGISAHLARKVVAAARRRDELPASIDAVRRGELSLDQLGPIVRHVPAWADEQALSLAVRCSVHQIQRTMSRYAFDPPPAIDDPNAAQPVDDADEPSDSTSDGDPDTPPAPSEPADRCWFGVGDDGRWRMFVDTTVDVGMIIEAALDEARDRLFRDGDPDVTGIDALTDIAHRSLDTINEPSRRNRFRINLHLDTNGTCCDPTGWSLPDTIRQHLTCDGLISPVFLESGVPVSVGRSQHLVPARTRNLVLLRDGGCRVPGCDARHHLEIHHIVHWENGGRTDTWNLVALCPRHHRLHHRGRLGITGNADDPNGVVFTSSDGRRIETRGAAPHPPNAPPPPIRGTYSPPLGERLDNDWIMFHPPPHHDGERRTN